MQKLNGLERILKALNVVEPDRVPHFEHLHDIKVREAILPNASYEDFIEYLDIDAINVNDRNTWRYEALDASGKFKKDEWGAVLQYTTEDTGHPTEPAIKSEKDLDGYVCPDPDEDWRYDELKRYIKRFKGERAIAIQLTDIWVLVRDSLIGDINYFKATVQNPDIIYRASEMMLDYQMRYLKNCIDLGADFIGYIGDWAITKGPFISRESTKKFLVPYLQKVVDYCHSRGVPCYKHTDGNIWPIYDLLVDTGIDGLHPIDPMAGMDMAEAKAKFGDRVCLMGNVNCGYTLCEASVEEVREETKQVIRKAGKGGGLIVESSNSIHSGVKPENYIAMVKAVREFGKYPLSC